MIFFKIKQIDPSAIASSRITMCRHIVPIEIDFILEIYQQKTREAPV